MNTENKIGVVFTEFELETIIKLLEEKEEELFTQGKQGETEIYNTLATQLESILHKNKTNSGRVHFKYDTKQSELNEDAHEMAQNLKGLSESAEVEKVMVENQSILDRMNKEYPETMDTFRLINAMQLGLFAKKQADYGPGNISMNGNIRLALVGLGVRMNDKTQRILNLTYNNKNEPNNESLLDSFMDISIYGIIAQILFKGSWGK